MEDACQAFDAVVGFSRQETGFLIIAVFFMSKTTLTQIIPGDTELYLYICAVKQTISIGLLFVLLVTSVQPTVAFHFCGGNFHSVGIGSAESNNCCGNDMDTWQAGNFSPEGEIIFSEPALPCCSDYTIEISTDTYQISSAPSIAPTPYPADFLFTPCLPYSVANNSELPVSRLQTIFPPGCIALHTTDLLTLICILRI
jgi:hypothetical protein